MHWNREAMRSSSLAIVAVVAVICLTNPAQAEIAPRSLEQLEEAELIVVGTIKQIRIESEHSQIERAFGNYDWGIYVTLAIESVERGQLADAEIEFRCFRIKSRRSAMEYFTPSGHRPIPGTGTRVRVYLSGAKPNWSPVLPNGITSPDATGDESVWQDGRLTDASEIRELESLRYTYVLPLELWRILVFVVAPVAIVATVFIPRFTRHKTRVLNTTEQTDEPKRD